MDRDIALNLRKFLVPEIVYGEGALELSGRHAGNFGASKAFIVTDPGVRQAGWTARVEQCLHASGIPFVVFDAVTPNPKDHEVMAGAEVCRREQCNLILAVGGGSPMDCAKGVGIVVGNGGHILHYEGVDKVPEPGPPLIFIPTTAGSSADISQFAIITDSARRIKVAIISKMVIPDIALVDPRTTTTMGPELTAATGMDALCHAFEAFASTASSPLTDMAALSAARLVFENLAGAYRSPKDLGFRNNMMMASLMAGMAFSNASLGLVHGMAHALGGAYGLPHGECNALLLEHVVRFNYREAAGKYDRLAEAAGVELASAAGPELRARALTEHLAAFRRRLGITGRLAEMGVSREALPELAGFALQDPCLATNPRTPTLQEIEALYAAIYE